jgi:peptidoglycan/xylan/chitin deacetylase (PgdA/CDA1 family)
MLIRALMRVAAGAGPKGRLSVLIFHRVLPEPDALFPQEMHARRFDEMCGWLKSWFNVLPLDQAVVRLQAGSLPERAACITFDDGYADNHDVAAPILKRHGLTATFFIATGFLDGGRMWNDTVIESFRQAGKATVDLGQAGCFPINTFAEKRAAIDSVIRQLKYLPIDERLVLAAQVAESAQAAPPDNLMMTSPQVKALRQWGMQIGAHTMSHPILARLAEVDARQEIKSSKDCLEGLLGERVGLFAYPNGKPNEDYHSRTVEIVRSLGFDAAVSTQWGTSDMTDDLLQIRRFTPWDNSRLRFGARMLMNLRSGKNGPVVR